MQRWFAEGRWLLGTASTGQPDGPRTVRRPSPTAGLRDLPSLSRDGRATDTEVTMGTIATHARRTQPHRDARPGGFTFVEVLVTTIVLGLLTALVIPSFLGTRDRANGATAESLLRVGAAAVETASVEPGGYADLTTAELQALEPAATWTPAPGARADRGRDHPERRQRRRLHPHHHHGLRRRLHPREGPRRPSRRSRGPAAPAAPGDATRARDGPGHRSPVPFSGPRAGTRR